MVQIMKEHFPTHTARLIYLLKSDYVNAMVRTGVITKQHANVELARILERSFLRHGIQMPDEVKAKL